MKPPSDTPRTEQLLADMRADHVRRDINDFDHYFLATGDLARFARELERETTALRESLAEAQSHLRLIELRHAEMTGGHLSATEFARCVQEEVSLPRFEASAERGKNEEAR